MNLSNLLARLERLAGAAKARLAASGAVTRIGDVVMATGVANDLTAPANDPLRPHIVARRVERRERRAIRSA